MNRKFACVWLVVLVVSFVGPLHVGSQIKIEVPARQLGEGDILADWTHDPGTLHSGVNFQPLPIGQWEDAQWTEAQKARCSNNRRLQAPTGGMNAIRWVVESTTDDPERISFDVSIDLPGSDPVAWSGQHNNSIVAITSLPRSLTWGQANQRGFYIASVRGATAPFTVKAVATKVPTGDGPGPAALVGIYWALNIGTQPQPVTLTISGTLESSQGSAGRTSFSNETARGELPPGSGQAPGTVGRVGFRVTNLQQGRWRVTVRSNVAGPVSCEVSVPASFPASFNATGSGDPCRQPPLAAQRPLKQPISEKK
jgi:hypothetical protein